MRQAARRVAWALCVLILALWTAADWPSGDPLRHGPPVSPPTAPHSSRSRDAPPSRRWWRTSASTRLRPSPSPSRERLFATPSSAAA